MKTIDHIPTGKVRRAGKLISTGLKVGKNQVKYYSAKFLNEDDAKERLDENNAEDIYNGLISLKGSSLKVAQMLSMDKNIMPKAYVEKFSLAQFSVPPLSAPLVTKTFRKYFGKSPNELYDEFNSSSTHAASIGQVHKAKLGQKDLAVKIQYPGVAESISSDLAIVKPFAKQLLNLKGKETEKYFKEVEGKLLEETDYQLEIDRSVFLTKRCSHLENIKFPKYYKDLSTERVITMDWMYGEHLSEFTKYNKDQGLADKIGQTLWDFYMYQIHELKTVHADPHPGNFLIDKENNLIAIDFGCIKEIPLDFYNPYFELSTEENISNTDFFVKKLKELEILRPDDSAIEREFFTAFFRELLSLFTAPFNGEYFDFGNDEFFLKIAEKGKELSNDSEIKKYNQNRGSKHFLYMNRTFFGLYNLLYDLGSKIEVRHFEKYLGRN